MITAWTKHLRDPAEKSKYEQSLRHSSWILDDLSQILTQLDTELGRAEVNPRTYDLPNWEYRQAHNNGYRQCLDLVRRIINLDQKENNDR